MEKKPAVLSFDDTEEDEFDQPQALSQPSSNPASSSSISIGASVSTPQVMPATSRMSVSVPNPLFNSEHNTSSSSLSGPPSPTSSTPPTADNRPRSSSFAKMRPTSMFVKSSPSIIEDLKKEQRKDKEKEKEKEKHESGTLSKLKASIFNKGKKPEHSKKLSIGTPSNFHHVGGQGIMPASLAAIVNSAPAPAPQEEKAEQPHSHSHSQPQLQPHSQLQIPSQQSTSIKSSKSHESFSSVGTNHTNNSDSLDTSDMLQSDPKAFTKLTKKKIDELINGAYFLQHTKSLNSQKFVSCSEDLSRLNLWANVYDKDAGVPPQEAYNFGEILGIKLGYSTPIFKDTGIDGRQVLAFSLVLQNKTTVDLEAFSPADREFWVESFTGLISLVKAQSIPAPMNRSHHSSNPGHVSSL